MVTFKTKHTSEHPLPDLRLDLEPWANFGLEQTFQIFKNLQNKFQLAESIEATISTRVPRGVPGGQITRYFGYHTSTK
jgi:hypothetical protein